MRGMSTSMFVLTGVVLAMLVGMSQVRAAEVTVGTTLENLQAAYNGESNARARYLAFAERADADGYKQAASLFRAAARAESIHAANHAEVITSLQGEPKADVQTPKVGSTQENLQAAIDGESYERDAMYPAFLKQARADGNAAAIRTLNLAKTAEAQHAKLYQEALDQVATGPSAAQTFYVCTVCGETLPSLPESKCPSCFSSKDKFVTVQ